MCALLQEWVNPSLYIFLHSDVSVVNLFYLGLYIHSMYASCILLVCIRTVVIINISRDERPLKLFAAISIPSRICI